MKALRVSIKEYFKVLAYDYSAAMKDMILDARQTPFKATVFTSSIFGLIFAFRKNPGERELRNRLADLRQQMVLIPWTIHSQKAVNCLEGYTHLLNEKRMDFCNSNEANDRITRQWPWIEFWKNCFDIGLFGRFLKLENSFEDCDIREEEFS